MRHRRNFNHLSRTSAHRKSMLANMATSLIMHKRIHTTLAKAKALRTYIEPLITKSKDDTTHSRRVVFSYLQSKDAVTELFREVSVKVAERPGGYTRIIKTGARLGDNAEMCMMELVDFNENLLAEKEGKGKSTRGRRRSSKKKTEATAAAATGTTVKTEETATKPKTEEVKDEVKAAETTEAVAEDKTEPIVEAKAEEKAEAVVEEKIEEKEELKAEQKVETNVEEKEEPKAETTGEVEAKDDGDDSKDNKDNTKSESK
ncbi:MAG: 50S ribosomal protein L17 [Bacteroidales bacterium]|nr:50S ribosomal protein L17 [Bacteroidales bacterium]